MSASMNPALAILLAMVMVFTAAFGMGSGSVNPIQVTATVDGEEISVGLFDTVNGGSAVLLGHNDDALYVSDEGVVLNYNGQATSVSIEDVLSMLNSMSSSLPQPTEDDLMALMQLGQGILSGISGDAVSYAVMGNGFSVTLDLDRLISDLNIAVPRALTTYASVVDPTLEKYSLPLFGQVITCADLADVWPELGLDEIQTGLKVQLSVMQQRNGSFTVLGAISDLKFIANISAAGLDLRVTAPDGMAYQFDTDDLLTLAELFVSLPNAITENAFNVSTVTARDENYQMVTTTTYTLNLTNLASDLNNGVAQIFTDNADTIDQLLNKYRSWIALLDADLANELTAANLAAFFQNGVISLPDLNGELVIVEDIVSTKINGYFGIARLTGEEHNYTSSQVANFTFTIDDRYDYYTLSVDYAQDYDTLSLSVNSSEPLFGLFRTLTFSLKDSYNMAYAITTDTDVFHFSYSDEEQFLDAKVGPLNFRFSMDENDTWGLNFSMPEFFVDAHWNDEFYNVDSTFLGLDYAETDSGFTVNGYFQEDEYSDRNNFGLDFHEETGLYAYLNGDWGMDYTLFIAANGPIVFTNGDETYVVTMTESTMNITCDGEPLVALTIEELDTVLLIRVYEGFDTTAEPLFILEIDAAPDALRLPAATPVDLETLLDNITMFLQ